MAHITLPHRPVDGNPEDISQIIADLDAILAQVNGNIDNSNIAAAAAIALSKLAGYPSDATKFARGDGTWAAPSSGTATIATTVAGLGTAADGKQGVLRVGSSAYDFLGVVYDSTYSKWVSPSRIIFSGGNTPGDATSNNMADYYMWNATNTNVVVAGATVPAYKDLYNAGMRLQVRTRGMFQGTSNASLTTTFDIQTQSGPNYGSGGSRGGAIDTVNVVSIGSQTNNVWHSRDTGWENLTAGANEVLGINWRWTSAGTQTMYSQAVVETRWVSA